MSAPEPPERPEVCQDLLPVIPRRWFPWVLAPQFEVAVWLPEVSRLTPLPD